MIFFRACIIMALPLLLILTGCDRKIKTSPERRTIEESVFASGQLVQEEEYTVAANADGIIERISAKEGYPIVKGAELCQIKGDIASNQLNDAQLLYHHTQQSATDSSTQLRQIQLQLEQAEYQSRQDKINLERYRLLKAQNSVSQAEFEKVQLQYLISESNLQILRQRRIEIRSDLALSSQRSFVQMTSQQSVVNEHLINARKSGLVLEVIKKEGEWVRKGEGIIRVGSGKHLMRLLIAEEDIATIALAQSVKVQLNTFPSQTFDAKITRILPTFDESEQSYIAEAQFTRPPSQLFSGTQLQAHIVTDVRSGVLVIPASCLQKGKYVTLNDGSTRQVAVGRKNNEWIEIRSGISEKDIILKATK